MTMMPPVPPGVPQSAPQVPLSKIIKHGCVYAGLCTIEQTPTQKLASFAEEEMALLFSELAIEGMFPRDVRTVDVVLQPGLDRYAMPAEAFDVVDTAMWRLGTDPWPPQTEMPVRPMSRQTYTERANKGAEGPPRDYFCDRTMDPLEVVVWPVPDSGQTGNIIRFQYHRLKTPPTQSNPADFERFWSDYLMFALAERMALASGFAQQASILGGKANEKKQLCKAYANERPNEQMVIAHRGGWRGRR